MQTAIAGLMLMIAAAAGCQRILELGTEQIGTSVDAREPANTAINQRDFDGLSMTPMDQKENSRDLGITANIRKSIVATAGLSVNARNIKVITAEGKVTLRGPVNSEMERSVIARIAREIAGKGNVANQMEVTASRNSDDGG